MRFQFPSGTIDVGQPSLRRRPSTSSSPDFADFRWDGWQSGELAGDLARLKDRTVSSELQGGAKSGQEAPPSSRQGGNAVTSDASQVWFVMLKDEEAAGKVIVPLKPFLRFSRRIDKQLTKLERRIQKQIPQLLRRGQLGRESWQRPSGASES